MPGRSMLGLAKTEGAVAGLTRTQMVEIVSRNDALLRQISDKYNSFDRFVARIEEDCSKYTILLRLVDLPFPAKGYSHAFDKTASYYKALISFGYFLFRVDGHNGRIVQDLFRTISDDLSIACVSPSDLDISNLLQQLQTSDVDVIAKMCPIDHPFRFTATLLKRDYESNIYFLAARKGDVKDGDLTCHFLTKAKSANEVTLLSHIGRIVNLLSICNPSFHPTDLTGLIKNLQKIRGLPDVKDLIEHYAPYDRLMLRILELCRGRIEASVLFNLVKQVVECRDLRTPQDRLTALLGIVNSSVQTQPTLVQLSTFEVQQLPEVELSESATQVDSPIFHPQLRDAKSQAEPVPRFSDAPAQSDRSSGTIASSQRKSSVHGQPARPSRAGRSTETAQLPARKTRSVNQQNRRGELSYVVTAVETAVARVGSRMDARGSALGLASFLGAVDIVVPEQLAPAEPDKLPPSINVIVIGGSSQTIVTAIRACNHRNPDSRIEVAVYEMADAIRFITPDTLSKHALLIICAEEYMQYAIRKGTVTDFMSHLQEWYNEGGGSILFYAAKGDYSDGEYKFKIDHQGVCIEARNAVTTVQFATRFGFIASRRIEFVQEFVMDFILVMPTLLEEIKDVAGIDNGIIRYVIEKLSQQSGNVQYSVRISNAIVNYSFSDAYAKLQNALAGPNGGSVDQSVLDAQHHPALSAEIPEDPRRLTGT
jgi:hypothetical protein